MQSNRARVAVVVLALAILVALFFIFRDDDSSPDETAATTTGTSATTTATPAEKPKQPKPKPEPAAVPEIVVVGGEPKGGVAELEFERGERIEFVVRSDVAEEIHVHGYDVTAEIPAGGKAKVSFPAELEGIFEVELHGSGALIAELTVEP